MTIFTIGHSTRPLDSFLAALGAAGVDCVVDVRRFPRSRRHPQFNGEALARSLAAVSILYRHVEVLGGRRGGATASSPNDLWREPAFRAYADHAESAAFAAALADLRTLGRTHHAAVMCAEAVWWRCHRRIIADYLLAAGEEVMHIFDVGKIEPARLTEGASVRADGTVLYAADQGRLAL
jgi:uncharacterized protein (DUF488 family)